MGKSYTFGGRFARERAFSWQLSILASNWATVLRWGELQIL
uniref:Uncharacterized protein n=1 Tax=Rhizophora mucronata TaxID=61149 RepID=A0A2P2JFI3_RHIMU